VDPVWSQCLADGTPREPLASVSTIVIIRPHAVSAEQGERLWFFAHIQIQEEGHDQ
jgi:hypothetical protein